MLTKTKTSQRTVTFPITALKYLYKRARGKKIVFEIDLAALQKKNRPNLIDQMVAEARREYAAGKTKSFTSPSALLKELRS